MKLPSPALLARCKRGIIFSSPLVPPILGRWKTATRRLDPSWLDLREGALLYVRESILREPAPVPGLVARFAADRCSVVRLEEWRWQRHALPAIHLPRALSRAVLRLTAAPRAEKLHDISEEEARAEGVQPLADLADEFGEEAYRRGFRAVWESLHTDVGQRWEDNPTLVRLGFELVEE